MYYVLFTQILQGGATASETVLHKRRFRICLKILGKYAYKEFLKIPF